MPEVCSRTDGRPLGLGQSPIVNVHLVSTGQVTDVALAAVVDSPIQFHLRPDGVERSALGASVSPSRSRPLTITSAQSSSQLVGTFFAALQALLPDRPHGASRRRRRDSGAGRHIPGDARHGRPPARRPAPRSLASSWPARGATTGWPATMEGRSAERGERAARACWTSKGMWCSRRSPGPWHPDSWRSLRWGRDRLRRFSASDARTPLPPNSNAAASATLSRAPSWWRRPSTTAVSRLSPVPAGSRAPSPGGRRQARACAALSTPLGRGGRCTARRPGLYPEPWPSS